MIYQEDVRIIVMITKEFENDKVSTDVHLDLYSYNYEFIYIFESNF